MSQDTPWDRLLKCVDLMQNGDWVLIPLREHRVWSEIPEGDDIDLLCSQDSCQQLLQTARTWVDSGLCHLHLCRRRERKLELTLFSVDGQRSFRFDLWTRIVQVGNGSGSLTFENVEQLLTGSGAIRRLPVDLEACLFVQHLQSKRKNAGDVRQQSRLIFYQDQLQQARESLLASKLGGIRSRASVTVEDLQAFFDHFNQRVTVDSLREPTSVWTRYLQWSLEGPARTVACSVIGCDGAGKTSLAQRVAELGGPVSSVYTGKHLYRKSMLYKLAVIFIRPLMFRSREDFDEILAPLVYLRACLGLRLRLMFASSRITLIDRALSDFLFLDRKSDHPRFSRFAWLMEYFGTRIPVIHCMTSFEILSSRKGEVTASGHQQYDQSMYGMYTERCPSEYIAFRNDASLDASAESLSRIIRCVWSTEGRE